MMKNGSEELPVQPQLVCSIMWYFITWNVRSILSNYSLYQTLLM